MTISAARQRAALRLRAYGGRGLPNHVLFAPCAAGTEGAVVPPRVLPSGSGGRDPTDGADPDGVAPGLGVTAMVGSRSARR
jgi:hypothetical protein